VALTDPVDAVEVRSETPFSLERQEGDHCARVAGGFRADPRPRARAARHLDWLQIALSSKTS
jgi:hypothetical protein